MTAAYQLIDDRLARALGAGRACHAFFLSGPDEALCRELARRAARTVCLGAPEADARLEECPDYFELNGANAKISQVREIIRELNHRPTGSFGRAIAVWRAHALSQQVQNALLKTIEEPPANTVFFLTGNADGVLPTIASRCLVMRAGLPGENAVCERLLALGAPEADARLYAAMSCGSTARGERLYYQEDFRALRAASLDALVSLLEGGLPAGAVKSLAMEASEALSFMLCFLSDMLRHKLGEDARDHPGRAEEAARLAGRFTIGKLACMIEMICLANAGIVRAGSGWYYAVPALNRLFLDISEVVDQ